MRGSRNVCLLLIGLNLATVWAATVKDPGAWLAKELGLEGQDLSYIKPKVVSGSYNYAGDEIYQKYQAKYEQLNKLVYGEKKFQQALELSEKLVDELTRLINQQQLQADTSNKIAYNLSYVQYMRAVCLNGLDRPIDGILEALKAKTTCDKSASCPGQPIDQLIAWLNNRLAHSEPLVVLGLNSNKGTSANMGQVKKAYRGYMLSLHPDKNGSDSEALKSLKRNLFNRVQEAFKSIQSNGF